MPDLLNSLVVLDATEGPRAAIERIPPPQRAALLMALLGLVVLALGLMVCVMLGGRWVRRIARSRHTFRRIEGRLPPPPSPDPEALLAPERKVAAIASTEGTLAATRDDQETQVE